MSKRTSSPDPLEPFRRLIMPHPENLLWRLRGVVSERLTRLTHTQRRMLAVLGTEPDLMAPLRLDSSEVHYTQALAWALDPERNGGLGLGPVGALLRAVAACDSAAGQPIADLAASSLESVTPERVLPSGRRVDVALRFTAGWLLIENKVGSDEHNHQLSAYRKFIDDQNSKHGMVGVLVYLTADEDERPPPCREHGSSHLAPPAPGVAPACGGRG